MNIIKYLVYLLIVFSVVKYYQKSMIDNNLLMFMTIIMVIGFMITDSFFQPKIQEGFGGRGGSTATTTQAGSVGISGICKATRDCISGLECIKQIGGPNYLCLNPSVSSQGTRR